MTTLANEKYRLGKAVRTARLLLGMTQNELSQKSGVHYNTINKIENYKLAPSLATIVKLFRVLDIEIMYSYTSLDDK